MDSRKRRIVSDNEDKPADLNKEWDETLCPICMEHPHNAILLVCSSHEKGCRSYVCDTSYRHSNCLDRFKKLKEKNPNNTSSPPDLNPGTLTVYVDNYTVSVDTFPVSVDTFPAENLEDRSNLKCPLCRGTVSGLRVIEEVRKYLNSKLRGCSHESCVFSGNYRELREHARRVHPNVRPADVDPSRERAWRQLEDETEYNDTVSAVPGSVVVGDYAIERGANGATRDEFDWRAGDALINRLLMYHMMHALDDGVVDDGEPVERYRRSVMRGYRRIRPPGYFPSVMDQDTGRRRRYLWGENLLGLQNHRDDDDDDSDDDDDNEDDDEEDENDEDDDDEDDEVDLNILSDIGPPRRRLRRRITPVRSENEDRQ